MSAWFSESDRFRMFTIAELEERLAGACSVRWFLDALDLEKRCKGKLVAGADILKALADPPPPKADDREQTVTTGPEPVRPPKKKRPKPDGTIATSEPLPRGSNRA